MVHKSKQETYQVKMIHIRETDACVCVIDC